VASDWRAAPTVSELDMWQVEKQFAVRFGGNTYIDTPDLVVYRGTSLFRMRRGHNGMLSIDFVVLDARGKRIARFIKNTLVAGSEAKYRIESGRDAYVVTERISGREIVRVQRRDVKGSELDAHVRMYLPNAFLLEAGPTHTNLGGAVLTDNVFRSGGAAIRID
jgi:hypothetical protein